MPIQITEAGADFIRQCLKTYQGETWFLLLFAGAMLLLFWLKDSESRTLRLLLWPYFTVLVCTVYNILIMQVFIRKLNLSGEYYRFFWLLPLGIVIPYVCTRLTASGNGRMKKILVFLLLTIVIAAAGAPAWSRKLPITSNPYRIPDDMIIACDIIKKDAKRAGLEDVGVVFDFNLNLLVTQYDPSFRVIIPYENMMTTVNTGRTKTDTDNIWLNSRITLVELLMLDRYWVPHEDFMSALNVTETAYVVYDASGPNHDYLLGAGLAEIGRTDDYVIYKYGWYFDRLYKSRGYVKFEF